MDAVRPKIAIVPPSKIKQMIEEGDSIAGCYIITRYFGKTLAIVSSDYSKTKGNSLIESKDKDYVIANALAQKRTGQYEYLSLTKQELLDSLCEDGIGIKDLESDLIYSA